MKASEVYIKFLGKCKEDTPDKAIKAFTKEIEIYWVNEYLEKDRHKGEILRFTTGGYTFLFSQNEDNIDNRVVGVYGFSRQEKTKRDTSRMRSFIGGFKKTEEYKQFDKGHFIAHLSGGTLDVNLYPQLTELNRGWSRQGKLFRNMERFYSDNPGTFIFTRPIYSDGSWVPQFIELGYITKEFELSAERFENFK